MDIIKYVVAVPILAILYLASLPMAIRYWLGERVVDRRQLRRKRKRILANPPTGNGPASTRPGSMLAYSARHKDRLLH